MNAENESLERDIAAIKRNMAELAAANPLEHALCEIESQSPQEAPDPHHSLALFARIDARTILSAGLHVTQKTLEPYSFAFFSAVGSGGYHMCCHRG